MTLTTRILLVVFLTLLSVSLIVGLVFAFQNYVMGGAGVGASVSLIADHWRARDGDDEGTTIL